MNASNPNRPAGQIAIRLRQVGKLADRIDEGADPAYVVEVATAIVASCSNVTDPEDPLESESADLAHRVAAPSDCDPVKDFDGNRQGTDPPVADDLEGRQAISGTRPGPRGTPRDGLRGSMSAGLPYGSTPRQVSESKDCPS